MATRNSRHPMKEDSSMPLSLPERQAVVLELASQYRKATKHERSQILDQVQGLCHCNRTYAARAMRSATASHPAKPRPGHGRKPTYGADAKAALIQCWAILNFPTGKRRHPFLPDLVARLELFGEITLQGAVRAQLLTMSAASIECSEVIFRRGDPTFKRLGDYWKNDLRLQNQQMTPKFPEPSTNTISDRSFRLSPQVIPGGSLQFVHDDSLDIVKSPFDDKALKEWLICL